MMRYFCLFKAKISLLFQDWVVRLITENLFYRKINQINAKLYYNLITNNIFFTFCVKNMSVKLHKKEFEISTNL